MNSIMLKDVNGNYVSIEQTVVMETLSKEGFTIFGMNIPAIALLRKFYLKKGGRLPINEEHINALEQRIVSAGSIFDNN